MEIATSHHPVGYNNIYGQEKAVEILKRSIVSKRIPHSLLFTGPTGTQKTSSAFAFLKHLKCTTPTPDGPCNICRNCYLFDHAMHPDVKILEPKRKARRIPIEDVKALIWFVQLKAYIGKYKIGLIKEADRLTKDSANALLKILEDPPRNTLFILITAQKNALLPTILSRCQEIDFFPVSNEIVTRYIHDHELHHLGPEDFLVMMSGGRVGLLSQGNLDIIKRDREMIERSLCLALKKDILGLLELSEETFMMLQEFSEELKEKIKEQAHQESYSEKDEDEMQAYIEGKVRERLDTYFNVFLIFLRDIFLYQTFQKAFPLKNQDKSDLIHSVSLVWNTYDIERRVSLLEDIRSRILSYANQKLALDAFYLGLLTG